MRCEKLKRKKLSNNFWLRFARVTLFLLAVLAFAGYAGQAKAQEILCKDRVIDAEGWLNQESAQNVSQTLRAYDRVGVQMYLYIAHTYDMNGKTAIERLAQELVLGGSCGLNSDAVVIAIAPGIAPNSEDKLYMSVARPVVIYGSRADWVVKIRLPGHDYALAEELASRIEEILQNSDWTTTQISDAIRAFGDNLIASRTQSSSAQPVAQTTPLPNPVPLPELPPARNSSGSWVWFIVIVLAIVLVGGAILVWVFVVPDFRQNKRQKDKAKMRAQALKTKIDQMLADWPQRLADFQRAIVLNNLTEEEAKPFLARLDEADRLIGRANEQRNIRDSSAVMDIDAARTIGEYEEITELYMEISQLVEQAYELARKAIEEAEAFAKSMTEAEDRIDEAGLANGEAQTAIAQAKEKSFKTVNAEELVRQAAALLAQANEAKKGGRLDKAKELATTALALATRARDLAAGYEDAMTELPGKRDTLVASLTAAYMPLLDTTEAEEGLIRDYNPAMWRDVEGDLAKAEELVKAARTHLGEIEALLSQKDPDGALARYQEAETALEEAKKLCSAITAKREAIADAEDVAPGVIAETEESLQRLQRFAEQNSDALSAADEAKIKEGLKAVKQMDKEFDETKPDLFLILKAAREWDAWADTVLADGTHDVQIISEVWAKIRSIQEEAERSVATTDEFIKKHDRDIDRNTELLQGEAREALTKGKQILSQSMEFESADKLIEALKKALRFFQESDEKADAALSEAKQDVRENQAGNTTYHGGSYGSGGDTVVVVESPRPRQSTGWNYPSSSTGGSVSTVVSRPSTTISRPHVSSVVSRSSFTPSSGGSSTSVRSPGHGR